MSLDKEVESNDDRILALIKRRGPQRIAELAGLLEITGEAARQRVARLAERGLITPSTVSGTRGRPAATWALTDAGHGRFPDRHAEVTVQLLDAVRETFGPAALERLIGQREATMHASYTAALRGARTLRERVRRLADVRSREGYMAEAVDDGEAMLLIENHCPICAAATACQNFCRSELDVFAAVLGDCVDVQRTDHVLAGARRCAYRITARKGASHGVDRRSGSRRTRSVA